MLKTFIKELCAIACECENIILGEVIIFIAKKGGLRSIHYAWSLPSDPIAMTRLQYRLQTILFT